MRNKLISLFLYMEQNYLSLSSENGNKYFLDYLKSLNIPKSDLKKLSFSQIIKKHYDLDLNEIISHVAALLQLKKTNYDMYKKYIEELKKYEMS